ncbi:hypothetical protein [Bacillus kexueae]|uniref:hypothetical protein n=1 Tax=Aeribacillus kexueae TaxID=2078952 RepID=UPI001FAFB3E6|nr:hypothetical protein [Bacillus kexueae]
MWAIIGITLIIALIIWIEVPSLLRNQQRKELIVFSVILLIGYVLSILEGLQVELPNPLDVITFIYKPISDWLYSFLE